MKSLLFHPRITLTATIGAVSGIVVCCTALIAAIEPLRSLPTFAQHIQYVDQDLLTIGKVSGVLASVLTAIAGLGRSFAPLIDNPSPSLK